jgi:hypothetical protein
VPSRREDGTGLSGGPGREQVWEIEQPDQAAAPEQDGNRARYGEFTPDPAG